jgi:hypothetical protein
MGRLRSSRSGDNFPGPFQIGSQRAEPVGQRGPTAVVQSHDRNEFVGRRLREARSRRSYVRKVSSQVALHLLPVVERTAVGLESLRNDPA